MIVYDLILLFVTLIVSIRKPHHFRRLFGTVPDSKNKQVIWIHAVSLGETKSVQSLFASLRSAYPDSFFLITTTTATGLAEARRSLIGADAFAYLPIDLSWLVRRWAKKLRPKLFILVESDFWPNLLAAIKKTGGKIFLVSGKLSVGSASRFARFPFFSKKLFACFDLLCVQNEEHARRFFPLANKGRIRIGGNLKLDHRPTPVDAAEWRQKISLTQPAITLSCTHAPEEEELLDRLPIDRFIIFLAPRHPERFDKVAQILERKNIPFVLWSRKEERRGGERVFLVDAMGQLPICYALSRLAIVAGSFQQGIGGHNILEPCIYGLPVLFGPHMFSQKELVLRILDAKAGMQVTYDTVSEAVETFFNTPSLEEKMGAAARDLIVSSRGALTATLEAIESYI